MELSREIAEWVARHPDKANASFTKTVRYRSKKNDRCRDAAHFVQQFTVGAIREAFHISGSDVEANSEPGTIAFRVRILASIVRDVKMPATARLDAEGTLWEIACYGALSHEPLKLGGSKNLKPAGSGLTDSFRTVQFPKGAG